MQSPNATAAAGFTAHSDVLDAPLPESAAGRRALLDELQRRGKAAVGAQSWPDAAALYRHALQVLQQQQQCDGDDESPQQQQQQQQCAILNANLSLCHAKMHHFDQAWTAAQQATQHDETYVKGWWRLGQARAALLQYKEATQAMDRALQLEPDNKALQKERAKYWALQEKQAQEEQIVTESKDSKVTTTTTTTVISENNQTTQPKPVNKSETTKMEVDQEEEEERLFSKSDAVRGYKIVNGKKTSYFHNELSEDAAKLIGDIAPKKLEEAVVPRETESSAVAGTSAWNKAGTWEEKDCTKWALDSIQVALLETVYTLPASSPAPNAVLTVTKVTVASGHASVAAVRGKKRYIYELDVTVHWKFVHGEVTAVGTLHFPDIDGTCPLGEGYDVSNFTVMEADDPSLRPVLENFCHQQGLREAIHLTVDNWVRSFKETY